jgi:hypothetical protein
LEGQGVSIVNLRDINDSERAFAETCAAMNKPVGRQPVERLEADKQLTAFIRASDVSHIGGEAFLPGLGYWQGPVRTPVDRDHIAQADTRDRSPLLPLRPHSVFLNGRAERFRGPPAVTTLEQIHWLRCAGQEVLQP